MVFKLQRGLQQLPLDAMYTSTHHHVKRWDKCIYLEIYVLQFVIFAHKKKL